MHSATASVIHVGIVTDFDEEIGAGLVQDDDGRILTVRKHDVLPCDAMAIEPGCRVHFLEEQTSDGLRAIVLQVFEPQPHAARDNGRSLH